MSTDPLNKISAILKTENFLIHQKIEPDTVLKELESWDSFKHVALLLELEREYNIEIQPGQIGQLKTIGDIIKLISLE